LLIEFSLTTLDSDESAFLHEIRRRLPRYHWRPLSGIRAGAAMADLQRLALRYGIRLPPSFALVGKTLSQADSIARILHPELDPVGLIREESAHLIVHEAEHRLDPAELLGTAYTQLEAVVGLPRLLARTVERLEAGELRIGVSPVRLDDLEHIMRSTANRVGAAVIVLGLLVSSALMAFV